MRDSLGSLFALGFLSPVSYTLSDLMRCTCLIFMLPYPQHFPSEFREPQIGIIVASAIGQYFVQPPPPVRFFW
jgi:hypothetical protein